MVTGSEMITWEYLEISWQNTQRYPDSFLKKTQHKQCLSSILWRGWLTSMLAMLSPSPMSVNHHLSGRSGDRQSQPAGHLAGGSQLTEPTCRIPRNFEFWFAPMGPVLSYIATTEQKLVQWKKGKSPGWKDSSFSNEKSWRICHRRHPRHCLFGCQWYSPTDGWDGKGDGAVVNPIFGQLSIFILKFCWASIITII